MGDTRLETALSDVDEEVEAVLNVAEFEKSLLKYGLIFVVFIRR